MQGTKLWLGFAEPQRWNLGRESLLWQGFPLQKYEEATTEFGESFLAELGGNAFAGSIVVVILGGIMALIPWTPQKPTEQTSSALKLAFASLKKEQEDS